MKFGKHFQALSLLRRGYKNWLSITWHYLFSNSKQVELKLRNSPVVKAVSIRDISNVLALPSLLENGWSIKSQDAEYIILEQGASRIKCRLGRGADIAHLLQIYVERKYDRLDFTDKLILDIGASNADSAIYFARKGAKKVIALEPSPDSYLLAKENVEMNGLEEKIVMRYMAASSRPGTAEFWMSSTSPNADTLYPTPTSWKLNVFDRRLDVECRTLEQLMHEFGDFGFVKMDCEGHEYELIRSLSEDAFHRIDSFAIEFHEGAKELPEILKRGGFHVELPQHHSIPFGYLYARRP